MIIELVFPDDNESIIFVSGLILFISSGSYISPIVKQVSSVQVSIDLQVFFKISLFPEQTGFSLTSNGVLLLYPNPSIRSLSTACSYKLNSSPP